LRWWEERLQISQELRGIGDSILGNGIAARRFLDFGDVMTKNNAFTIGGAHVVPRN
jgi:hypothetical protein